MLQRLDKILAGSGLLTRSQAKEALRAGRVQVDGVPARDGAAKVDPGDGAGDPGWGNGSRRDGGAAAQ